MIDAIRAGKKGKFKKDLVKLSAKVQNVDEEKLAKQSEKDENEDKPAEEEQEKKEDLIFSMKSAYMFCLMS